MGKIVTLGEIMLRLSTHPGERIGQNKQFQAHFGGGEANVAISLANFGHDVSFASKVPNSSIGMSVKKHLQRYGVETTHLLFGGERLGTYYMESGIGERGTSVIYDRKGSSFAEMTSLEWSIEKLFRNADIFHISGIVPALAKNWPSLTLTLIQEAKKAGCKVSFDMNYRSKLWTQKEAGDVFNQLLPYVDICSAGEKDALYLLDIAPAPTTKKNQLNYYYQEMHHRYPNITVFYSTKRKIHSASANQLTGTLWMNHTYYESQCHEINPIVDRVGGGDAFAGGVLHGLLSNRTPQEIVNFATAASALKHTIHGDCNQFTQEEVQAFLTTGSGKIIR